MEKLKIMFTNCIATLLQLIEMATQSRGFWDVSSLKGKNFLLFLKEFTLDCYFYRTNDTVKEIGREHGYGRIS